MNLLYFRIAWDFDFLIAAHSEVVKTDEFVRSLLTLRRSRLQLPFFMNPFLFKNLVAP